MFLKKYKQLIMGIVIGSVLAGSSATYAALNVSFADFKFKFDGVEKQVPAGYTVLQYQDRTYVPARFVAENLGAKVDWDASTDTVIITSKQSSSSNQTNNPTGTIINKSDLPYTYKSPNGMQITVNSITADSSGTVLNVTLTNQGKVDGDSMLSTSQIMAGSTKVSFIAQDKIFYDGFLSFHPGQSVTGNITFAALPSNTTQFTFYYQLSAGTNYDEQKVTFDLSK